MEELINEIEAIGYSIENAEKKRHRASRLRGSVPFGYKADASGRLTPDANEQRTIELIHDLRKDGYSYQDIADELKRRGIFK